MESEAQIAVPGGRECQYVLLRGWENPVAIRLGCVDIEGFEAFDKVV